MCIKNTNIFSSLFNPVMNKISGGKPEMNISDQNYPGFNDVYPSAAGLIYRI
jgi:hypothetical protein